MFEAIVTICALAAPHQCRDALIPGFEASSRAACEEALADINPKTVFARSVDIIIIASQCQPLADTPDRTLAFEEVVEGVFVHVGRIEEPDGMNFGDVSNIAFVIGADSVAVIDSGSARWMGEATWRAIKARTDRPVSHVILTHMHPDHIFGAGLFKDAGTRVVGHGGLDRALADRHDSYHDNFSRLIGTAFLGSDVVAVDQPVVGSARIDLGGRVLEVMAWPTAHSPTDLSVLDVETGTFLAGDLIFDHHVPALDGSLRGWQQALDNIAQIDIQRIVPGHGGPVLGPVAALTPMARYLDVLETGTIAALGRGERIGEAIEVVGQEESTHWALFDAFNARNATVAYTQLEWD